VVKGSESENSMAASAIYPDLKGKHVLITGGTGGIGAGVTPAFVEQGCVVTTLGRSEEHAEQTRKLCAGKPGQMHFYKCDLADADDVVKVLDQVQADHGDVDVLINNAGWDPRYDTTKMTVEQWDHLFDLNIRHYFLTCRKFIPGMRKKGGGSIIMTTSHQFWIGFGELAAYNATKGAIIGYVRALAREVGKDNIRVNAIAPGWVMTERQLREMITPERQKKLFDEEQILPMFLKPEDLAPSYVFLASEVSKPITRQTLVVDAGFAMS
jgi:NAD(P)-dependent dehydrogenase (short-subunit alcohol dehydrogenase family)